MFFFSLSSTACQHQSHLSPPKAFHSCTQRAAEKKHAAATATAEAGVALSRHKQYPKAAQAQRLHGQAHRAACIRQSERMSLGHLLAALLLVGVARHDDEQVLEHADKVCAQENKYRQRFNTPH
eukprot:TRINITY_DN300_c0_g1_i3.p2 TRINITY_DN300_c0_g1~~TRINITY_DN300_c0_g1_i3.p2  ORF type:complete len:124 (+),score=3.06 TRINITY_DN300_c0_g1_i3:14-385(+)